MDEYYNLLRIGTSRIVEEYSGNSGSYRNSFRRRHKSKSSTEPSPRKLQAQASPHQENIGM